MVGRGWTVVGSARSTTGARSVEPSAASTPAATAAAGTLSSGSWRPCSRTTQPRANVDRRRRSNARQAGWVRWAGRLAGVNLPERKAPLGHGLVTALFPRGCGCRGSSPPWRGAQAELGTETGLELPASARSQFSPSSLIPSCHAAHDPPTPIEMIESRDDPKSTSDRRGRVRDR